MGNCCESVNTNKQSQNNIKVENKKIIEQSDENNNHYVLIDKLNSVKKSVCKIIYNINNTSIIRTGFFMTINNQKYLITSYENIYENLKYKNIQLEIYNKLDDEVKIKLSLDLSIRTLYIFQKYDSLLISINNPRDVEIFKNVPFPKYEDSDLDYEEKKEKIFIIGYQNGEKLVPEVGNIMEIIDPNLFNHNINIDDNFKGSPIIKLEFKSNEPKIIGMNKLPKKDNIDNGVFIKAIVDDIKGGKEGLKYGKVVEPINSEEKNNFIFAEIDIPQNYVGQEIPIICSCENKVRNLKIEPDYSLCNEKEIKKCIIEINNIEIGFSYTYKFTKKGKYVIIYSFKEAITNINCMFANCSFITYIDFSNFNSSNINNMIDLLYGCSSLSDINFSYFDTKNVIDMKGLFEGCRELKYINLSSFDTHNVENMSYMFSECSSLLYLDLSKFNTENVLNMEYMFAGCYSLANLELEQFDTKNVENMLGMFFDCKSLISLGLSKISTKKVKNMTNMFSGCMSLTSINLTGFNTENVNSMDGMFNKCKSLKYLDLSSFDTKNVSSMACMFCECSSLSGINLSSFKTTEFTELFKMFLCCGSLNIEDVITNDKRILKELENKNKLFI